MSPRFDKPFRHCVNHARTDTVAKHLPRACVAIEDRITSSSGSILWEAALPEGQPERKFIKRRQQGAKHETNVDVTCIQLPMAGQRKDMLGRHPVDDRDHLE